MIYLMSEVLSKLVIFN